MKNIYSSNQQIIFAFILIAIAELLAQFFLKHGTQQKTFINQYFILAIFLIIFTYSIYYSLLHMKAHISVIHAIHHSLLFIFILLMGGIFFEEKMSRNQFIGLFFCIIGIYLLANEEDFLH